MAYTSLHSRAQWAFLEKRNFKNATQVLSEWNRMTLTTFFLYVSIVIFIQFWPSQQCLYCVIGSTCMALSHCTWRTSAPFVTICCFACSKKILAWCAVRFVPTFCMFVCFYAISFILYFRFVALLFIITISIFTLVWAFKTDVRHFMHFKVLIAANDVNGYFGM